MKQIELNVKDRTQMNCVLSEPKGAVRAAVIILQEAFGVNTHIKGLVEQYAREGFLAIAPELYHRTAPSGWTCGYDQFSLAQGHYSSVNASGIIEDVRACFDYLRENFKIEAVATVGFCMGGKASFIANSEVPLKAAVSYYGGGINPEHLHLAAKQKSPILMIWGGLDSHISVGQVRGIEDKLTDAKKVFSNIVISNGEHGFATEDKKAYHPGAARLAWAASLEFLKTHL